MHKPVQSMVDRPHLTNRLPDGYARLLYDHQYRAKKLLEEDANTETEKLLKELNNKNNKSSNRPDRQIYQPPGLRQCGSDISMSTSSDQVSEPVTSEQVTFTTDRGHTLTLDMKAVDLPKYIEEARPIISKAVADPSTLLPRELERVASWIVNRAWEDVMYYRTAAELCVYISQKERDSEKFSAIPEYAFQRSLCICLAELMDNWDMMRAENKHWWHSFVQFTMYTFRMMSEKGEGLGGLCTVLYDVITALLSPLCMKNDIECELLYAVWESCGEHLQKQNYTKMEDLVWRLRNMFLEPPTDPRIREVLLHMIELRASDWALSQDAEVFYEFGANS